MTVLNAAQKTTLRSRPHRTRLYLSFYQPRTVFQCQVNNPTAARSDMDITFDNVTVGTFTLALAGMTVLVGSTQGGRDKGRLRVRKATAVNTLYVAENDDVQWADNLWLTVVNYYEPWGVYPNIVLDASNIPTFYKDWDVVYTDQNSILDPIPVMGPNRAGMLEPSTGLYGAYFDGSNSYDLNSGGTITSYAWAFESGSQTASSSATPGWVYWNVPGHYVVSLTVTNNQGKTFTGRRYISVYNRYSGSSTPIRNFMIDDMSGDYSRGGWSCRFRIRESVPQSLLDDGTLVVVFAEDWYAGVKGSIGGNYSNAEDIVFTGYLMEDTIEIDPYTSEVVAEAVGVSLRLDVSQIFSVSIQSVVTPTTWYQLKNMTVDKAMHHYLRWHTTVYTVSDVRKNGNVFEIERADFPKDIIRSALDGLLSSALLAHFVVDRQGQVWMETKTNVVPVGSRTLGTTTSIAAHDWRDRISIRRRRRSEISYVEVGGIYYAGPATGSFQAIMSSAPGNTPRYYGREQIINGLALSDQTTNNQLAGDIIAMLNSEFPEVRIQLSGNYRVFDIAPQERCSLIVYPADNQWGLNWFEKSFIPRTVNFTYDRQDEMLLVDAVLEEETDGIPGVTGPYPTSPPDDVVDYDTTPIIFPEVPPIPVVVPEVGDGTIMFAVRGNYIVRTSNFLEASPTWENITGVVTGTLKVIRLDPWDPANKAVVMSSDGVWYTTNSRSSPPTWIQILTLAQMRTLAGNASYYFLDAMMMSPTVQGFVGLVVLYEVSGSTRRMSYIRTSDYSAGVSSWVATTAGDQLWVGGESHGFWVSQHNVNRVFISFGSGADGIDILYSIDGGLLWAHKATGIPGSAWEHGGVIFIPYKDNAADNLIYIALDGAGGSGQSSVGRTTTGVVGTWSNLSAGMAADVGAIYGPKYIDGITESPLVSGGSGIYLSGWADFGGGSFGTGVFKFDGTTWTTKITGAGGAPWYVGDALGGWPYDNSRLQMWRRGAGGGTDGTVIRSTDGGITWVSAHGNLDSITGAEAQLGFLVPIWVAT